MDDRRESWDGDAGGRLGVVSVEVVCGFVVEVVSVELF